MPPVDRTAVHAAMHDLEVPHEPKQFHECTVKKIKNVRPPNGPKNGKMGKVCYSVVNFDQKWCFLTLPEIFQMLLFLTLDSALEGEWLKIARRKAPAARGRRRKF